MVRVKLETENLLSCHLVDPGDLRETYPKFRSYKPQLLFRFPGPVGVACSTPRAAETPCSGKTGPLSIV